MGVRFKGRVYALHAQIALVNKAYDPSLPEPEWVTGEERCVIAPGGVYVATANDTEVLVTVQDDLAEVERYLLCEGWIEVREDGLAVGNLEAADVYPVDWSCGQVRVRVYADSQSGAARTVNFVLG